MIFGSSDDVFCATAQAQTVVSSRSKLLRKAITIVFWLDVAGEVMSGSASNFAAAPNRRRGGEVHPSVTGNVSFEFETTRVG